VIQVAASGANLDLGKGRVAPISSIEVEATTVAKPIRNAGDDAAQLEPHLRAVLEDGGPLSRASGDRPGLCGLFLGGRLLSRRRGDGRGVASCRILATRPGTRYSLRAPTARL
jgi:hypothetical protein